MNATFTKEETDSLLDALDGKTAYLLINKLPERYQKVLHMRYALGLSLHEISEITGQSKNAVAVQVHRALERLRVLYNK
ncbi:MAG: sigma-70 region 4 domain-containing protein [Candidatus Pacebacteria bacterium]|nr:sigma-70 region 4 domain-containing protein [Candidatus Paceibacterota bacterium]